MMHGRWAILGFFVLLCLFTLVMGGCEPRSDRLVGVSSERDALEVLVALEDAGIGGATLDAQKDARQTTWVVRVPVQSLQASRKALVERNLPREHKTGLAELVDSGGIIPTPSDERARLMAAMAGDLERTLESITGVVQARVNVVLPIADPLGDARGPSGRASASVLVKYDPSRMGLASSVQRPVVPLTGEAATTAATSESDWAGIMRGMVVKSLAGFDEDADVVVTFTPVSLTAPGTVAQPATLASVPRAFVVIFVVVGLVALGGIAFAAWTMLKPTGNSGRPAPAA